MLAAWKRKRHMKTLTASLLAASLTLFLFSGCATVETDRSGPPAERGRSAEAKHEPITEQLRKALAGELATGAPPIDIWKSAARETAKTSGGNTMQKITPHLWFDKEAKEAAEFYVSAFGIDSKITDVTLIRDTPSGDTEVVSFSLRGQDFMAISAGPLFTFNPSVSFFLNYDPSRDDNAEEELNAFWTRLSEGGTPLMELGEYPFSRRYGWIQDKYGVSWQLILSRPEGDPRPFIVPSLLFVGEVYGRAEEAMKYYVSIFGNAKVGTIVRFGADQAPDREGAVMFEDFQLLGQWFAAMESAHAHDFAFNEAISLIVNCDTQDEVDYYWEKLTAEGGSESMCGWLKDKYGLSWQVVPTAMGKYVGGPDPEGSKRATAAMLKMRKIDLAALERAYKGK